MAIEIVVPRLGWSMEEGTLTQWLKRDGEWVRKGEMLFVLEGDKAAQEVECFEEGILKILPNGPQPGDSVIVGQLLGYLVSEGEPAPFKLASAEKGVGGASLPQPSNAAQSHTPKSTLPTSLPGSPPSTLRSRTFATPRARRRAAELGVDWVSLVGRGSGKGGRIREKDLLAAIGLDPEAPPSIVQLTRRVLQLQPHSAIRRTIAAKMVDSCQRTAAVTLTTTADATNLVLWRQRTTEKTATAPSDDAVPGLTDCIVKLTAIALESFPLLNSRWEDSGIVASAAINIGIAVDTEAGLLVPVVRRVEQLSVSEVAARSRELILKARARELTAAEMQEGTFTVTNLGSYGIDAFTPIIQLPQCAILGVGRMQKTPVFRDNQFVPRDVITLSLTFDHRIVDGGPAARFLQAIVRAIENAADLLAE